MQKTSGRGLIQTAADKVESERFAVPKAELSAATKQLKIGLYKSWVVPLYHVTVHCGYPRYRTFKCVQNHFERSDKNEAKSDFVTQNIS